MHKVADNCEVEHYTCFFIFFASKNLKRTYLYPPPYSDMQPYLLPSEVVYLINSLPVCLNSLQIN